MNNNLSIFVDESGDFGPFCKHTPYYIITMVMHEQSSDIAHHIRKLNDELVQIGHPNYMIHTEPLIRRENEYKYLLPNERRAIFSKLYFFFCKCDLKYKTFIFKKKENKEKTDLELHIIKELSRFISKNLSYFQQFEKIILYYDNGQHELSRILEKVLDSEITGYEMRKVLPCDYKLFQVADLLCTLELLKTKVESGDLSRSERLIFHSKRELKKDFLKGLEKRQFN